MDRSLDLDAVRTFVAIAELGSFTRAAELTDTTQSAVSLKLKRLEERVGHRLIERTPRSVQLSARGELFLLHARQMLEAHDRAIASLSETRERITIGISDHVAGPELPELIARLNANDPQLVIEIRISTSAALLQAFDRRECDAVLVRFNVGRNDGEQIATEPFGWFASSNWGFQPDSPLPIATMPEPCGVRSIAEDLLDEAGFAWAEVFVGGGVPAVSAAVAAGLGVAALAPRMAPVGAVNVGRRLKLPVLPRLPVILHARTKTARAREAIAALVAAFKGAVRS